jgi:hypothetical protein
MYEKQFVAPSHEYKWISLYEMSAKLAQESLELVESAGNNKEYSTLSVESVFWCESYRIIQPCEFLIKRNGKTQR